MLQKSFIEVFSVTVHQRKLWNFFGKFRVSDLTYKAEFQSFLKPQTSHDTVKVAQQSAQLLLTLNIKGHQAPVAPSFRLLAK